MNNSNSKHIVSFSILMCIVYLVSIGPVVYGQTQSFLPVSDASVYLGDSTHTYASADLIVKKRNGYALTRYVYLKFNLASFALSDTGRAVVRLYCRTKQTDSLPVVIRAYGVNDTVWQESTLNWVNKPAFSKYLSLATINQSGSYYEWDISGYVQTVLAAGSKTLSVVLADMEGANNTVTFNAEENASNKPALVVSETAYNASYYIDADNGHDTASGLSPSAAWKSLAKVNSVTFSPGARILFKADGIWNGQLSPRGSGTLYAPVTVDSFGQGALPVLNGNGMVGQGVIYLSNLSFWEVNHLEVTNNALTEGDRRGVEITADNYGLAEHIYVRNLHIHHIKGRSGHDPEETKTCGIFVTVTKNDLVDTRYNDLLIEGCSIHHITDVGIATSGLNVLQYPGTPGFHKSKTTNLNVRNNIIHHIAKNAMIIRLVEGGLVEHNLCYETALDTTGNTIFSTSALNTVFQYNEGYLNRSPAYDGSLYDADLRSPGTIWQYSYSHDNKHGLMWYCTNEADTGIIVRYNISQNDSGNLVYFNYPFTSTSVYNNTFYLGKGLSPVIIAEKKTSNINYSYFNNIVYDSSKGSKYGFGSPIDTVTQIRKISHNLFYGRHPGNEPVDSFKITSDPLFINPGSGGIGLGTVDGYKLRAGSPAINSGRLIVNNGGKDYFGNPVSDSALPNRGFYSAAGIDTMNDLRMMDPPVIKAPEKTLQSVSADNEKDGTIYTYPNPVSSLLYFHLPAERQNLRFELFNMEGKKIYTGVVDQAGLNVSGYGKGMYTVNLIDLRFKRVIKTLRFIKN